MTFTRLHRPITALVAALLLAALTGWVGERWSATSANNATDRAAEQAARSHAALLASELQKFRLLPLVLSEYPDVAAALSGSQAAQARLNATLELLAERTDAADIYAIDQRGATVAASNWRRPTSFVGQNYGFRPYFRDAMARGAAELFALGTVSRRPGLYLARRVGSNAGRTLGVIVVKVEFDSLEAAWARTAGISFVADANGVILITGRPDWRFRTIGALAPVALARAQAARQYGPGVPRPAPLTLSGNAATATLGDRPGRYRVNAQPVALAGARLYHLAPQGPALAAARAQALLLGLGLLLVGGIAAAFIVRAAEKRRLQATARAALEDEVARRTAELHQAHDRYRAAREELAQANRLGTLGQITAGVAHEINQPVAAIRAFAENGETFLDRGAHGEARDNLTRIVELADRIGTITGELRGFARRQVLPDRSATLGSVLDGAVMLLGERVRGRLETQVPEVLRCLKLAGDRVRIEQVLVNLLQNALDQLGTRTDGLIRIEAIRDEDHVTLSVEDNGGGIDPKVAATLFDPFVSAKPEGLGLGLAIARDIAREFGGELSHAPGSAGARFLLQLRTT